MRDSIVRELASVREDVLTFDTLERLKARHPDFRLWSILSEPEQEGLFTEEFRPRSYAKKLVLRRYGVTSEETLKKDRRKLREAGVSPDSL